jgi:Flp pilus assembly protein CpaB
MELEYRDESRRGRYFIILGVVLAIVAGGAAFFLINQAQQSAATGGLQTTPAVVATRTIPARKPIEAEDLAVRDIPIDATNAQGIVTDPSTLVGKVLAVPALEGQLVTQNLLASTTATVGFSILNPSETVTAESAAWRAVSITVPDAAAVGGMIQANQTVDVFVTATVQIPQSLLDKGKYYTDRSTKLVYQNLLVLSRAGSTYIVKATLAEAEELAHLAVVGNALFSMALRPDVDTRIADATKLGETTNLIITRYGLPIPETYPAGSGPISTLPPIEPRPTPTPDPLLTEPAAALPGAGSSPTP